MAPCLKCTLENDDIIGCDGSREVMTTVVMVDSRDNDITGFQRP